MSFIHHFEKNIQFYAHALGTSEFLARRCTLLVYTLVFLNIFRSYTQTPWYLLICLRFFRIFLFPKPSKEETWLVTSTYKLVIMCGVFIDFVTFMVASVNMHSLTPRVLIASYAFTLIDSIHFIFSRLFVFTIQYMYFSRLESTVEYRALFGQHLVNLFLFFAIYSQSSEHYTPYNLLSSDYKVQMCIQNLLMHEPCQQENTLEGSVRNRAYEGLTWLQILVVLCNEEDAIRSKAAGNAGLMKYIFDDLLQLDRDLSTRMLSVFLLIDVSKDAEAACKIALVASSKNRLSVLINSLHTDVDQANGVLTLLKRLTALKTEVSIDDYDRLEAARTIRNMASEYAREYLLHCLEPVVSPKKQELALDVLINLCRHGVSREWACHVFPRVSGRLESFVNGDARNVRAEELNNLMRAIINKH